MDITIHRGTKQIGGCVTEICAGDTRIFIDLGSELPGADGAPPQETLSVPGVTCGEPRCDAVFFTHTHGDHIGQIDHILPGIPLYMGEAAREISLVLNRRLDSTPGLDRGAVIRALERAQTFTQGVPVTVGSMKVTPLCVNHSAFDAYMFLIEADGVKLLHTGDFRGHGLGRETLVPMLKKYVGRVDYLVCEGTMLSRDAETVMTENALSERARELMREHKQVFVVCSSTNIDRIAAFYRARLRDRPVVCDKYQKEVLNAVEEYGGKKRRLYEFGCVIPIDCRRKNSAKLLDWMNEKGFLMFVRPRPQFREFMEPYKSSSIVVYSMWSGYLSGPARNQSYVDFLEGFDVMQLHTSGHATEATLREVYETVGPCGLIPIHSEEPERFRELLPGANVLLLRDGEKLTL